MMAPRAVKGVEEMKKVIAIGGAGFIGTNLCLSALKRGLQVVVFDNLSRKGSDLNLDCLRKNGQERLEVIEGDVRSIDDVQRLFERHRDAAAVFHLAGQVAVTTSIQKPREDFEINLVGTLNVLETIRKNSVRAPLLYASTNKVYGGMAGTEIVERNGRYQYRDHPRGISEDFPLDFHSPYGCSKGAADQYVLDYSRIFGLKTVVFRQSCIYGYHQFGMEDQGWVAWFIIASLFGMPITVYGNGKQVRDVLFVDDLVEAYWAAIDNIHVTNGEAYNIGGSEYQVSLLQLLQQLEALLGKRLAVKYSDPRPGDQLVFISDVHKARQHFGWAPRTPVSRGVTLLADWVMVNKQLFVKAGIIR